MDRVNAEGARRGDVRLDIVDVDSAVRINGEALDQQLEDAWVRFDHLDLARDENPLKPAEKREALDCRRIRLGRPVGEAVKRGAAIPEFGQYLHRAGDGAGHHLIKAGAIGLD
jgi:hypothetical protein